MIASIANIFHSRSNFKTAAMSQKWFAVLVTVASLYSAAALPTNSPFVDSDALSTVGSPALADADLLYPLERRDADVPEVRVSPFEEYANNLRVRALDGEQAQGGPAYEKPWPEEQFAGWQTKQRGKIDQVGREMDTLPRDSKHYKLLKSEQDGVQGYLDKVINKAEVRKAIHAVPVVE